MSDETKLLPCPFCGSDARVTDLAGWEVLCNGCTASIVGDPDASREEVMAVWNTRAPDTTREGQA